MTSCCWRLMESKWHVPTQTWASAHTHMNTHTQRHTCTETHTQTVKHTHSLYSLRSLCCTGDIIIMEQARGRHREKMDGCIKGRCSQLSQSSRWIWDFSEHKSNFHYATSPLAAWGHTHKHTLIYNHKLFQTNIMKQWLHSNRETVWHLKKIHHKDQQQE